MKNQTKIVGQKIIGISVSHDYAVATLENGMEIEISEIMSSQDAEKNRKAIKEVKAWKKNGRK